MKAKLSSVILIGVALLIGSVASCGGGGGEAGDGEDQDGILGEPPLAEDAHVGEPPLPPDGGNDQPPAPDGDDSPIPPDALEDDSTPDPCSPPDTVNVGGRCVPSCTFAGGNTCGTNPTDCGEAPLIESYDCAYCCFVEPGDVCVPAAEPGPAAGCIFPAEIVIWGAEGWNVLGDAFHASESPCANTFISIPPQSGDKTLLRAGEAARMHARGPRIHAMAEFHWGTWNDYHNGTGTGWREIGHIFRTAMQDAGYCVESGDTWAVNEAPSTVRTNEPGVRAGFIELMAGLYEGAPGMTPVKGAVFVWGMGHATFDAHTAYKPSVKTWLQDAHFWEQMNLYVRWWGQEVYTNPTYTCVGADTIVERARYVSEFVMHVPRLAAAAPDSAGANTAQSYFSRAFVPVMNSVWWAAPSRGYGDTEIPLVQMRHFITLQVRAARGWADGHTYPDGRIGFAFASYAAPETEWDTLAGTMAVSILGAYNTDGAGAAGACVEGGVDRWCNCNVTGSSYNDEWQIFGTW